MKAIGIKMVELQPMTANEACIRNYKTNGLDGSQEGYEVTYPDGYKSWCPKEVADKAYFKLIEDNNGSIIMQKDVENFIAKHTTQTIGVKTILVQATTITGFELIDYSACVSPKNYSQELGEKYAMENIINKLWGHLGFVLQWAKNGLNKTKEENMNGAVSEEEKEFNNKEKADIPPHVQRMIVEYRELVKKTNALGNFLHGDKFKTLAQEEQDDMQDQYYNMINYAKCLERRLTRYKIDSSEIDW